MEAEMGTSPSFSNQEDLSGRDKYRRYGKRLSPFHGNSGSKFTEPRILFDGDNIQRRPNAALLIEEIKQEIGNYEVDGFEGSTLKAPKRRASLDSRGVSELNIGHELVREASSSLKSCKLEEEALADGETSFTLFASLFDSALQGLMPFTDLILQFENTCRNVFESIRYGNIMRHHVVEDRLMRQKAQILLDEAASWSLLWYLFGKGNEDLTENLILSPATSHQKACSFVVLDHSAQLCLRIVLWLEGLASKALDLEKKVKGSHVGSYLPSSGVWHHTQRFLKKKVNETTTIQHLDFDAPTREAAPLLSDDKKQDESLLEDIWILLRAGRLEEACELCRSAGQPWRAATLCPFGGLDQFPSIEAMQKNGKTRALQAFELQSCPRHQQLHLWKWSAYCASEKIPERDGGRYETAVFAAQCSNLRRFLPICTDWESACWAMAKSWLDIQVDLELARFKQGGEQAENYEDPNGTSWQVGQSLQPLAGPESWPYHVLDQQPRDLSSLLQKLHSGEFVHEAVSRACKEQHRQIEMNLMLGDISHLLDLLWLWISPSEDDQNVLSLHGDQMIRFAAHLVLVIRYLITDEVKDAFKEKLMSVGDHILHMYAMFLFSKQHEELVGIYASQLARHRCIDLFVHMMEQRLNSSAHVKYKIFLSAMEYLPFSPVDDSKPCFEDIIERVLSRSREVKVGKYDEKTSDVAEQHRLQSLQKAMVIQWLCFTPPSTARDFEIISAKLLIGALMHSNTLFREFALISMWRVPKMPIGAHMLLSYLAEPLKQPTDTLLSFDEHNVSENLHEFEEWRMYYSCDATYRNWFKVVLENADVPSSELSLEERERAISAARETLNSSLSLLLKGNPWLTFSENSLYETTDSMFLELHATAMLCLPSGECLHPDATLCTTLASALYSSVTEEDVLRRQLMINVTISPKDHYCIEVALRCLAVTGDGLGLHESSDGGLLATAMAAGFKGELFRFQAGVTMEISRLDAWYSDEDGSVESPASYIVRGLCRRCCLPEIILRCMQVSVSLAESGHSPDRQDELIDIVASTKFGLLHLFSQHQLQEFLLFERDCFLYKMEFQEEQAAIDDPE